MKKQDDYQRTALRLPRDLHARIHEAAEKSERSFNAEIVARLEQTFDAEAQRTPEEQRELEDRLSSMIAEKLLKELRENPPPSLASMKAGLPLKFDDNDENEKPG
jgi:hypothetical protein